MPDQKVERGSPAGEEATAGPKVRWDDRNLRTSYANVSNVTSTREEVVLLFGVNQAWEGPQPEVTVQLSDRIILSPYAAKRLSLLLQNVLSQYEQRFGELEVISQTPQRPPRASA